MNLRRSLDPQSSRLRRAVAGSALIGALLIAAALAAAPAFASELAPIVSSEAASDVHSDAAMLHAVINPNGTTTKYHFEYGTSECSLGSCEKTPAIDVNIGSSPSPRLVSVQLSGLTPGTTYHWRVEARNIAQEVTFGAGRTFTTYPYEAVHVDNCPNAHVRQQTSAALLPDCRAYELASAANTGGYDVESDLSAGQTPYPGYPDASGATGTSRLLYGIDDGAIPGVAGEPTNNGIDPYVATRGSEGWNTEYVGVPAGDPFALKPFSSVPTGASSDLSAFAFSGEGGCSPCFEGGYTGIPVRLANGELVQGMVPATGISPPGPGAKPDGHVAEDLSADGDHLIFGSTSKFAEGGNAETGDVSIYDRDLAANETYVVSNAPSGGPLACLQGAGHCDSAHGDANGISELAVSADGSRVLLGQKVSEDSEGNVYWHLYMNIGDSDHSVDLTPGVISTEGGGGFAEGALFAGMTEDGGKVFFTTKDPLTADDTDHSADLYEAEVSASGELTLTRVSTGQGGTGNTDSCDPVSNQVHTHWNVLNGEPANCGVVAIGGAGGVATASGNVYFLSPELLAGSAEPRDGIRNAPNLYLSTDGGAPRFVTTLESSLNGPNPPLTSHPFVRAFGAPINPGRMTTDPSDGDIYVAEGPRVLKFEANGKSVLTWGEHGVLTGAPEGQGSSFSNFGTYSPLDVAVGPNDVLYVMAGSCYGTTIFEFEANGTFIAEHALPSGECFESVTEGGGIEVNSTGDIYIDNYRSSLIVFNSSYTKIGEEITQPYGMPPEFPSYPRNKAFTIDRSNDNIYVLNYKGEVEEYVMEGPTEVQGGCTHLCEPTRVVAGGFETGTELAVDESGNVYVDQGSSVIELAPNGEQYGELIGVGRLEASKNVTVDASGNVFVGNPNQDNVFEFGPSEIAHDPRVENPVVVDSVSEPENRHTSDFEVSPSGDFAVFTSTLPLTGFESGGQAEIYRFDAAGGSLACASCDPSGVEPTSGSELAADGLSLTDDGRVFFSSAEPLALRDSDNVEDVYEWEPAGAGPSAEPCSSADPTFSASSGGCLDLISSGTSAFDSGLLGVSADGTDVFIFTRDSLAPQDHNGAQERIYDAREFGGFAYTPPPVPCKASDECHGTGSPAPGPADIHINTGTGGNAVPASQPKCKKGFVAKKGKCVKKPHPKTKQRARKHHKRKQHHKRSRSSRNNRGTVK